MSSGSPGPKKGRKRGQATSKTHKVLEEILARYPTETEETVQKDVGVATISSVRIQRMKKENPVPAFKDVAKTKLSQFQIDNVERILSKPKKERNPEDLEIVHVELEKFSATFEKIQVPPDAFKEFCAATRIERYPRIGTSIFEEGDPGSFFIVLSGNLRLTKRNPSTRLQDLIGNLAVGDCFGEQCLLEDKPCTASVSVDQACALLLIDKYQFDLVVKPFHLADVEKKQAFLREIYAFDFMSPEQTAALVSTTVLRRFKTGTVLAMQGNPAVEVAFVTRGQAQVFKSPMQAVEPPPDTVAQRRKRNHAALAKDSAYQQRLAELLSTATLVGELWRGDCLDPQASFMQGEYAYTVIASSILDLLVLPVTDALKILPLQCRKLLIRRGRDFPAVSEIADTVKEQAKWRKFTRSLVAEILRTTGQERSKRLLHAPVGHHSTSGYPDFPKLQWFQNSQGQSVPLAVSHQNPPLVPVSIPPPRRSCSALEVRELTAEQKAEHAAMAKRARSRNEAKKCEERAEMLANAGVWVKRRGPASGVRVRVQHGTIKAPCERDEKKEKAARDKADGKDRVLKEKDKADKDRTVLPAIKGATS
mmetsp:Transcript_22769/g.53115  ORF Transcript_22769/g.53115 Transcript_22769/m.53115 type:complete len:592 (-) Transcript_22769:44-1819(-)